MGVNLLGPYRADGSCLSRLITLKNRVTLHELVVRSVGARGKFLGGFSFQQDDESFAPPIGIAEPVHPPTPLILAAASTSALGLLFLIPTGRMTHLVGYVCSSLLTIGLAGAYRRTDARRRTSGYYSPKPMVQQSVPVVIAAGLVGAAVHSWYLARLL